MMTPLTQILIVDDILQNVSLLATILKERGYKTLQLADSTMVMQVAKSALPDLILLDVMMPELNGYEVCQQLKEDPATSKIPVIFISALDDVLDKVKAFECGGVDYITKPFYEEEVLARVRSQLTIQKQQRQLETLLSNILPQTVVDRLKQDQTVVPVQYEEATFLFVDIVGFTLHSAEIPAAEMVNLLNQVFTVFDQLVERYDLEKISTIGDAYFVAGGLPKVRPDHAKAVVALALDMQAAIQDFHWPNGDPLCLRMGIHTGGPVVAAVIGVKKFAYDVWGNAVNIASRMESEGAPGRIHVSETIYEQLKESFRFEKRGLIAVKGRGEMLTYWLMSASSATTSEHKTKPVIELPPVQYFDLIS